MAAALDPPQPTTLPGRPQAAPISGFSGAASVAWSECRTLPLPLCL